MTRTPSGSRRCDELVPTRASLLERLRDLSDHDSWHEFFNIYWKLLCGAAIKAGLTEQEAKEVAQETMLGVARRMKTFRYEPKACSFKGWLMHVTQRRIIDCLRKRRTRPQGFESLDTAAEIPDAEAERAFQMMWTEEWQKNLLKAADECVRRNTNPGHYQIYYLHCVQRVPVQEVSELLHISALKVHVVCHRVARKLKREVQRLENKQL